MKILLKSNYIKSLVLSYGSIFTSALIGFITVPFALNYFGKSLYGLFAITLDTMAYLALFNFGIPCVSAIIFVQLDSQKSQVLLIKKSIILLVGISLLLNLLLIFIYLLLPNWINFIAHINDDVKFIAKQFIMLTITFFTIRLPFSLFNQLLIFLNKMYLAKTVDIISTILTFICLLIVIYFKLNIVDYAIINGIFSFIPVLLCAQLFYKTWKTQQNDTIINTNNINTKLIHYSELTKSGLYYFFNNIASLILWNTGSILIGHYLGLLKVAEYAILLKFFNILFMTVTQLVNIISPLYPKFTKEQKYSKLSAIYESTTQIMLLLGGLLFILIFGAFKEFVTLWTHNKHIFAGHLSCYFFALYCYFISYTIIPYSAIIAMNASKHMYKVVLCEAITCLVLSILLVNYMGIAGIILSQLVSHLIIELPIIPKKFNKLIPEISYNNYFKFLLKHATFTILPISIMLYYLNHLELNMLKVVLFILTILFYLVVSYLTTGKTRIQQMYALLKNQFAKS
ncbi:MAG: lipopolysaccharide biosynthesis protein [Neisseriaceae bacterium]